MESMSGRRNSNYPPEMRERAIRMVAELTSSRRSQWAAIEAVASRLGIGSRERVRRWVRQAEVDGGQRPGVTSEEQDEVKLLRRENFELRRANEILKTASAFFAAAEPDRQTRP
jgi:transposase